MICYFFTVFELSRIIIRSLKTYCFQNYFKSKYSTCKIIIKKTKTTTAIANTLEAENTTSMKIKF